MRKRHDPTPRRGKRKGPNGTLNGRGRFGSLNRRIGIPMQTSVKAKKVPMLVISAAVPMGIPMVSPAAAMPAGGPVVQAPARQENLVEIKSPLVGTFYAKPSPDSELFIEVGSHVEPQTVVCIIEAMKVMNEIKAEMSGTIAEIVATSGEAVEYGQVLFRVKPD